MRRAAGDLITLGVAVCDLSDHQSEIGRLRRALRAAGIGIWEWDLQTGAFSYSAEARAVIGASPETEITLPLLRSLTHPDDLPITSAQAAAAIGATELSRQHYEYRIVRADTGETRWVRAEGEAVFAPRDGSPTAITYLGTIEDIHTRKQAELALADAELRQRLAIDAARMALWEYDIHTERLIGSPEINRLFGFPDSAEPALADFTACYLPGEQQRVRHTAEKALADGRNDFEAEFRIRRTDGDERWMLLRAEVLSDTAGANERVIGVLMDIDERKQSSLRQDLLLRELNHRTKNSLSVIQAIAGQTFRDVVPVEKALRSFQGRLAALAAANDAAMAREEKAVDLRDLIERVVAPYRDAGADPFSIACEAVPVPSALAVPIALALHELATNAAKYGALSHLQGRVAIVCEAGQTTAELEWKEETSLAGASPSGTSGFGTRLLKDVLARQFRYLEYVREPDGIRCRIGLPLPAEVQSVTD